MELLRFSNYLLFELDFVLVCVYFVDVFFSARSRVHVCDYVYLVVSSRISSDSSLSCKY